MANLRAFATSCYIILLTIWWSALGIATWPLSPSGRLYLFYARLWARMIFSFGGIQVDVLGTEQIDPKRTYIYMANHQSLTDILALFFAIPQPVVMVAKKSVRAMPIFGWGMWMAGFVFIDRSNHAQAVRSLDLAGEQVRRKRSVLVFPEGTRSRDGVLQPFKKGGFKLAQKAGVPIVPVGIAGTMRVLPRDHFNVHPGRISVAIGEPIDVRPDEDVASLMERVRGAMEQLTAAAEAARHSPRAPAGVRVVAQ